MSRCRVQSREKPCEADCGSAHSPGGSGLSQLVIEIGTLGYLKEQDESIGIRGCCQQDWCRQGRCSRSGVALGSSTFDTLPVEYQDSESQLVVRRRKMSLHAPKAAVYMGQRRHADETHLAPGIELSECSLE